MSIELAIPDGDHDASDLVIRGLRFLPNRVVTNFWRNRAKVISNTGSVVGHFVTHGEFFQYDDTIGLHLGQIDRLTFVSSITKPLRGTFIDCRYDSATFGTRVALKFTTSPFRRTHHPLRGRPHLREHPICNHEK